MLLSGGVLIVAASAVYYFIIRPVQKEEVYRDCFSAIVITDNVVSVDAKRFVDICTQAGGIEKVSKSVREASEKKLEKEEVEKQEKIEKDDNKSLTDEELFNLKLFEFELTENNSGRLYDKVTVRGKIRNENNFDVQTVLIGIEIFSDKDLTNKLGESKCRIGGEIINPMTFYSNSTKKFDSDCRTEVSDFSWFTYKLLSAERKK